MKSIIFPSGIPNTQLSFLASIVKMSKQMQMEEDKFMVNEKFQDHDLKIGVQNISENDRKALMKVSEQYFTSQICIFLLFGE